MSYPFTAIVGQEPLKRALLIALLNPKAGGLLIGGPKGSGKTVLARSCSSLLGEGGLVNLPLNITEDMLFGSLDVEQTVLKGEKALAPGLLAKANGKVLYIDETNLLGQDLLLAVLEAQDRGFNLVEREGLSYYQQVELGLIATMNPEEGLLPKPVLARFGMYVEAEPLKDIKDRIAVLERVLAYERDPVAFCSLYKEQEQALAQQVAKARELLPAIEASEPMVLLVAQLCAQAHCPGHRGELFLWQASCSLAALEGRAYVLPKDVQEAAKYVLPHRQGQEPSKEQEPPIEEDREQQPEEQADNDASDTSEEQNENPQEEDQDHNREEPEEQEAEGEPEKEPSKEQDSEPDKAKEQLKENIAAIAKNTQLPKLALDLGRLKGLRRGTGKRSVTRTNRKQGRYVRAMLPQGKVVDLAFDATLRAAAPYQGLREKGGCAVAICHEDLRQKLREKRIGNTFIFAVDASGSMGARQRMEAVKGAIFQLLQEAYENRDRVAMLAFRRQQAQVLLPVTRSVDLAQRYLAKMATGGKTPLAAGLSEGLRLLKQLSRADKEMEPIFILVTDGRANSGLPGEDPVASALTTAAHYKEAGITSLVIDTEADFIKLGLAKKVAAAMGATYYSLEKLSREKLLTIVRSH